VNTRIIADYAEPQQQKSNLTTNDQILNALRRPSVPWGARVVSFVGEGGSVANAYLCPGPGLDKAMQAEIQAHSLVSCTVCADLRPTPPLAAFHGATIRWAIENADWIGIWPPDTQLADAAERAADAGANFLLTIETTPAAAVEWAIHVCRYKRADTPLVICDDPHDALRRQISAILD
jgi:hypothetical protein